MAKLLVKELCKQRGISLKTLAERMHITPSALSQSLNTNPSIMTLEKVAQTLGVDLPDLFEKARPTINGFVQVKDQIVPVTSPNDWVIVSTMIGGLAHPQRFDGIEGHEIAISNFVKSTIGGEQDSAMMAWFATSLFTLTYDSQTKRYTLASCAGDMVNSQVYQAHDYIQGDPTKGHYESLINAIIIDLEANHFGK